jgi:hypothetical protein
MGSIFINLQLTSLCPKQILTLGWTIPQIRGVRQEIDREFVLGKATEKKMRIGKGSIGKCLVNDGRFLRYLVVVMA